MRVIYLQKLPQRIQKKIRIDPDGCWRWLGIRHQGYGWTRAPHSGPMSNAHRVVYEMVFGTLPQGLHVDHLCRVKECVNPDHLEAVSPRVNILRGEGIPAKNARKTHCLRGHPLSGANLYVYKGGRWCRECRRERNRSSKRRRRCLNE